MGKGRWVPAEVPLVKRTDDMEILIYPKSMIIAFYKLTIRDGEIVRGRYLHAISRKKFSSYPHVWRQLYQWMEAWT